MQTIYQPSVWKVFYIHPSAHPHFIQFAGNVYCHRSLTAPTPLRQAHPFVKACHKMHLNAPLVSPLSSDADDYASTLHL